MKEWLCFLFISCLLLEEEQSYKFEVLIIVIFTYIL